MKEFIIVKFMNAAKIGGFNIKPGFWGLYVAGKLAAVSSGWCCGYDGAGVDWDTSAYIYTKRHDGRWIGRWVDFRGRGALATFADYIRTEANDFRKREEMGFYRKGGGSYETVHWER